MLIGVVSDTHNNIKNIKQIISLFNNEDVVSVIHTGDIASEKALEEFSSLNSKLIGVYGNNDRSELGLDDIAKKYSFSFQNPPKSIKIIDKRITIFHEPDEIDSFILENPEVDLILHGHTHRYRNEVKDKTLIFNPGESAGMLKGKNAIGIVDLKGLTARRVFFWEMNKLIKKISSKVEL